MAKKRWLLAPAAKFRTGAVVRELLRRLKMPARPWYWPKDPRDVRAIRALRKQSWPIDDIGAVGSEGFRLDPKRMSRCEVVGL